MLATGIFIGYTLGTASTVLFFFGFMKWMERMESKEEAFEPIKPAKELKEFPKKHMTWCEKCKGVAWCYGDGLIMCEKCGLTVKNAKLQHEEPLVTFCEHCKRNKTNEHNERK
ncbi:hypothetical protein [Bacillus toyonensis]|uniref:hypothetical protein n=1 Tax=Bacillus toyonensis TaxID=155322 RepID=UPI000BF0A78B|nr:hypothetical protein [Bacillus toyonensis]PEI49930.1 hypothetical protein CN631_15810 [Bacillus toyonensis]